MTNRKETGNFDHMAGELLVVVRRAVVVAVDVGGVCVLAVDVVFVWKDVLVTADVVCPWLSGI